MTTTNAVLFFATFILGPLVPTVIRDQANGSSDLPPKVFLAVAVFGVLIVVAALIAAWRSERAKRAELDRIAAGDPDAHQRLLDALRRRGQS